MDMPDYYEPSTKRSFTVSQGIGHQPDSPWFTLYQTEGKSGTHRLKSPALPYRDTKEEAQADLDDYAKTHGFELVQEVTMESVLDQIVNGPEPTQDELTAMKEAFKSDLARMFPMRLLP
jgi:hypothetical protein